MANKSGTFLNEMLPRLAYHYKEPYINFKQRIAIVSFFPLMKEPDSQMLNEIIDFWLRKYQSDKQNEISIIEELNCYIEAWRFQQSLKFEWLVRSGQISQFEQNIKLDRTSGPYLEMAYALLDHMMLIFHAEYPDEPHSNDRKLCRWFNSPGVTVRECPREIKRDLIKKFQVEMKRQAEERKSEIKKFKKH